MAAEEQITRTGGRPASTGVIPGDFALSVGKPDRAAPPGWTWTLLTDVARLETGHTPSRRHPEYWDGDVPWIGIRDATDSHGCRISDTLQHTTALGIENSSARILPANTVCLSRTASVGYVVVMGRPMATSQDFVNWVCSERLDHRFLKYVLLAERSAFMRFASGTTHQTIYFPEVKAFHVCLPPIEEQRRISDILGALDDKIDLNRRMAETLESIARALFKSWFVDFDPVRAKAEGRETGLSESVSKLFPSELKDSAIGDVPRGWRVTELGNVCDLVKGRSYKSEELSTSTTALVTLKSFQRGGGYRVDGLKEFTGAYRPEQAVAPGEVIVACTDVTQAAELIGRSALVYPSSYETLVASLDVMIARPKTALTRDFLYLLGRTDRFVQHNLAHSTGTTVLHLAKKALPSFLTVVPPQSVLQAFGALVGSCLERLGTLHQESEVLSALRDALLPKLISGELRAPAASYAEGESQP